ncbi:MAG TPA: hypothetical protein VN667_21550 [Burkholderiales bacterium]|nr:hypothetical protein [Burkholderiales bacterium]
MTLLAVHFDRERLGDLAYVGELGGAIGAGIFSTLRVSPLWELMPPEARVQFIGAILAQLAGRLAASAGQDPVADLLFALSKGARALELKRDSASVH